MNNKRIEARSAARVDLSSAYDRREAALDCFHAQREHIQQLIYRQRERGLKPSELPGLERMLKGARQARDVMGAIDLELAGA